MLELLSEQRGAALVFVSSFNTKSKPGKLISEKNIPWLSTGLFPQTLVFDLGQASKITSIDLKLHKVKALRLDLRPDSISSYTEVAQRSELAMDGQVWNKHSFSLDDNLSRFVRLTLISGHDSFVGVSGISILGDDNKGSVNNVSERVRDKVEEESLMNDENKDRIPHPIREESTGVEEKDEDVKSDDSIASKDPEEKDQVQTGDEEDEEDELPNLF